MSVSVWDELDEMHPVAGAGGAPGKTREPRWVQVCVCGHLAEHHPLSDGGTYADMPTDGCTGPRRFKSHEFAALDDHGQPYRIATCPCREWRPVAEFDAPRPSLFRGFLPRPTSAHPFVVAMKGLRTSLSKRVPPDDLDAELGRRFRWLDGARVCSVDGCATPTDGVWPVYAADEPSGSAMRCRQHARTEGA
jgi:hypothetical protein